MTPKPYPLLCRPALKSKIWGGDRLAERFGKGAPGERIGETWEVADLPEGASTIANGPLAGATLTAAMGLWGGELAGAAWTGGRFPLLVKFIDANDDLSVQVHPGDADCARFFPDDAGKDESWIVVESDGGQVLYGFNEGVGLDEFDRRVAEGAVEECLRAVTVKPGDVLRLAPGTVHALCRGVLILEIQQPSDSTFRIHDYGRVGDDGRPRPLHLERARKVLDFAYAEHPLIAPTPLPGDFGRLELLVDVPAYRIERAEFARPAEWRVDPRTAQVVSLIAGRGALRSGDVALELVAGDTVVLPAATGAVSFSPQEKTARAILSGAGGIPLLAKK